MTSRRDFLKSAGTLIVTFGSGNAQGPTPDSPAPSRLDSWIAIAADGSVVAYSGKEELGQGIYTAQMQLIAEELCVPFDRVKLTICDTGLTPDQAHTSGSQSHPANFNHDNLALACATAREALLKMASQKLGAPLESLKAADGAVSVKADPAKRASYSELIGGRKFNLALDPGARRKPPGEWTVLGTPVPRPDMAAIATGRFEFVHNVKVPGMLHGRVVRPPTVGATLARVDESSVKDLPGIVRVVVKKNFVGVVAEKPWQAVQAAAKLKVEWTTGPPLPAHAGFVEGLRARKPTRDTLLVDSGDLDRAFAGAASVHKATYCHPYQMHGSVGSSCAVADVRGETATIWSATQAVWYQRTACATLLGIKEDGIRVIFRRGSGCYGLNGADAVTYDAAILSQAVRRPVRVQLSRKDEMAWENFGNAFLMDERAALDAQGNILAWEHESWSPTLGNRPGPSVPGNVISGALLGYAPEPFAPRAATAPTSYNNGSNGIPSYFAGRVGTANHGHGVVKNERALIHNVVSPFFTGPLRSPARLQNTFAHECFMDELAAHVKADPVEYRLRHLSFFRMRDVVTAVAKAAQWTPRPSPDPARARTGTAKGRGIACVAYEGSNGYSALVAEVEVHLETGTVVVKRMVAASDCGPVSNPDGLRNQVEGGALQGMSRALGEEVAWDAEKVTSVDWSTYKSLPLGFDVPKIETVPIDRRGEEANGAGETSITVAQAAIGNAIFDATGARIRQAPFTPERVLAALHTRG